MTARIELQLPASSVITHEVDVYLAMSQVRRAAIEAGYNDVDRTKLEIIVLELARNLIAHTTSGGMITCDREVVAGKLGLSIVATDNGPGIIDIEKALQDGYSTAGTLGAGLPGVQRLADKFVINSTPDKGTTVYAWKALSRSRSAQR